MDEFDLAEMFGDVAEQQRDRERRDRLARTLPPGIYRQPDTEAIFRVRLNRAKTRVYSEQWARVGPRYTFVYDPQALGTLRPEDLLPLEEARQIAREAGQCLACAAILTDEKSQAAGIGPVCAKSWTRDAAERVIERNMRLAPPSPKLSVRARAVGDRIVIRSDYDATIIKIIKTFEGYVWNERSSEWSLPRKHANDLAEAFALVGIAHDDVAIIAMGWDVTS
jgi:hypothetical protein